ADVSERTRMEAELRRAHKMEVVGMLAGGVAHDFNNLLTVISVHTQFLLEEGGLADAFRDDAVAIRDAADRAASLTRQLLLFSRKQVAERRLLDLNVKLRNVERMLRRTIGSHIEFVAVTSREPVIVYADPAQVEQMIMNLALNARDAMPDGGALVVETSLVTDGDVPQALLTVSDTGIGMDADTSARIFEPFFTTKEQGKGTGLGLATAYSIVQDARGSISVESAPGAGSTFRVRLPLAERRTITADEESERRVEREGHETILLVEDQDAVRNVATRILRSHGYVVLPARHGNDALAMIAGHPGTIDLLLSDLMMPEMNGHTLAARVRALLPNIRIVFMSGYSESLQGGTPVDATIPIVAKPFESASLIQAVRGALDVQP
ncbi:MAG: putative Histidine kinase, partial [Gemmatimonadetes bacterium]|nr:putative Histidine kinase [Gemmatimonadota bacterium]